jgi:predicted dehydrogenase/nucleoside-diphosphate-sugar epimerase
MMNFAESNSVAIPKPAAVVRARGRKVRLAVVGCGAIARSLHLPVVAGHEDVELVALVDRDVVRASELARGYGVKRVLPDVAALDSADFDAAILATPPQHHAEATIDLLKRGVHVLVEKPMATTLADAEAMVRAAEETGRALAVGFFRRLYPSIRLLRALLDSNWLGRPVRFVAEGGGTYNWAAATLGNMKKELAGGGVLIDYGSHILDLLFALFDEPAEVLNYRDNALGGVEADCSLGLRLRHAGDPVEGTLDLARTRNVGNFIRVECERGMLEFQVNERHRVRVMPHGPSLSDPLTGDVRPYRLDAGWFGEAEDEPWYETFRRQIDDWLGAMREGWTPRLSGKSCLPTVRLIDACYRSRCDLAEPWVWAGAERAESPEPARPRARCRDVGIRKVLVTGASGFIGCRVAELLTLHEGCTVRAAVHNPSNASRVARLNVQLVQTSLEPGADFAQVVDGCDAVVHCAVGTAYGDRRKIFDVTVGGTRGLVEAARAAGVRRFVHISTMGVYGDGMVLNSVIEETAPVRPPRGCDYGQSKAKAEQAVAAAAASGLPAVVLRPARVFGPFATTMITRPVGAIAAGHFGWLGSPDLPCDMVYVDNVVEAICCALVARAEAVTGQIFNVGDGLPMTWREFYEFFGKALGVDLGAAPVCAPAAPPGLWHWPTNCVRGALGILTSAEFKALGRRVLATDGIGSLPRWALDRLPFVNRLARRLVKADDALPAYRRAAAARGDVIAMGSGGALLSIEKARRVLGYGPAVSRHRALELTLNWIYYAHIV